MADRVDTGGLTTALQLLGAAGHAVPGAEAVQDDLFEAEAPLPLPPAAVPERTGKAGRPAGARNKSTEEWVRYFLSRYRSPMTALAEIYSRPTDELVAHLQAIADKHSVVKAGEGEGITVGVSRIHPLEVAKMQIAAASALLPYVHKKQPMAIEVDQRPRGMIVMDLGAHDVIGSGSDDLGLGLVDSEEKQRLSEATPAQSDAHQSDASEKQ